jgi:hypothetical protein
MTELTLSRAGPEHVAGLAGAMRPADVAECLAIGGGDPAWHVGESIRLSAWAMVALTPEDLPVAAWGVRREVRRDHTLVGVPWCLTTVLVSEHRVFFARCSVSMVDLMRLQFDRLENLVHWRHAAAVRWLGWLGFMLDPPFPAGPAGEPFSRFWWRRGL